MQFKINKPVRLIELFGGIGTQAMALKTLGVPFEHWRLSEWDVNACKSYKAIHFPDDNTDYSHDKTKEDIIRILCNLGISNDGKTPMTEEQISHKNENWLRETYNNFRATKNIGSVMNRTGKDLGIKDTDKYTTILFYSFPCQDISLAGKQRGFDEDSNTRSSLLWQVKRLLLECKELGQMPEVLVMENVSAIHNKKNMPNFQKWLDFLDDIGYSSYWKDLNAKNYGIPQNRDRTFCVSVLSNDEYVFPETVTLEKRLKDYLENTVDEKYYVNNEKAQSLIVSLIDRGVLPAKDSKTTVLLADQGTKFSKTTDVSNTLMARDWKGFGNQDFNGVIEEKVIRVGYMDNGTGQHQSNTVINTKGLSPAITTIQGGTQQIKILGESDE